MVGALGMRHSLPTVLAVLVAAAGIGYGLMVLSQDLRRVSDDLDAVARDMSTMSDDVRSIADDVNADERYLACFASTRSEIVVPIVYEGRVVAEIDIH